MSPVHRDVPVMLSVQRCGTVPRDGAVTGVLNGAIDGSMYRSLLLVHAVSLSSSVSASVMASLSVRHGLTQCPSGPHAQSVRASMHSPSGESQNPSVRESWSQGYLNLSFIGSCNFMKML